MGKNSLRETWERIRRPLGYVCSGMIIMIVAMVGLFWYYTGRPSSMFEFFRTLEIIESHYAENVDKNAIFDGALKGMVSTLGDKHSLYLGGDLYKDFSAQMSGSYAGIGVYIASTDDGILIAGVMEGSPAEEAGLQRGDILVSINGTPTQGMQLEDVSKSIRGPVDTSVDLVIRRDGAEQSVTVARRQIHIPTVAGKMVDGADGVGYIRVAVFSDGTADDFTKKFNELREQGMTKLILDLRDNPGGIVEQAVGVASNFVPPNSTIVSYTEQDGKEDNYTAQGTDDPIPIVVLVNENSASASEIVAGAVQDMKLGPIVGVKTYGKGTVQGVFPVDQQSAVKVTVAKYRTTNGREIDGVGIEPDVVVPLSPSDQTDTQFEKALEIISQK
ncbi:S41 family peptidase [uncultured Megasphaera sp.]|uniref:S41 family peptidase n=1 Tax=uncultured Megasphaera sp. TaxID=165188 RepID=UPI002868C706|nr:S41 family peptidase [uncultured Megasphaera sp.]